MKKIAKNIPKVTRKTTEKLKSQRKFIAQESWKRKTILQQLFGGRMLVVEP